MTRFGQTLGLLALALLVGCASGSSETSGAAADIPVSRDAGPGATLPDGVMAAQLFRQVCVATDARHGAMLREIAKLPFVQDPESEIYYHQTLNLSFKARRIDGLEACSFVAKVKSPKAVRAMLVTAGKDMQTSTGAEGSYVHAVTAAR